MKIDNNNFITSLNQIYKQKHQDSAEVQQTDCSLFEGFTDKIKKYKNKLLLNDTKLISNINKSCQQTIKNMKSQLATMTVNTKIALNITLPQDDTVNTTFITIYITKQDDDSFDIDFNDNTILYKQSLENICQHLSIPSTNNKELQTQLKTTITSLKWQDIKYKLALFNKCTVINNDLTNKTKYHIASFAQYKSDNLETQKKLISTLSFVANLDYKFRNKVKVKTKFGNKLKGKIKFSTENIKYSQGTIELTNKEQLFDICLQIAKSDELKTTFKSIAANIKNKDEIFTLVSKLSACYKILEQKPVCNLSKPELKKFIDSFASQEKLNTNLEFLGIIKSLGYSMQDINISQEEKIILTNTISWISLLEKLKDKKFNLQIKFLSTVAKNHEFLLIEQTKIIDSLAQIFPIIFQGVIGEIYQKLIQYNVDQLSIIKIINTLNYLKRYGYDLTEIDVNDNGTIYLTNLYAWKFLVDKLKSRTILSNQDTKFIQSLVATVNLISIKRDCDFEFQIKNTYNDNEDLFHKLVMDIKRNSDDDTITIDDNISIAMGILQTRILDLEKDSQYHKKYHNQYNPIMIKVFTDIANDRNNAKIAHFFTSMLNTEKTDFTNEGTIFIKKLYHLTQWSILSMSLGIGVVATAEKTGTLNDEIIKKADLMIRTIATTLLDGKNQNHRIVKFTYLRDGSFDFTVTKKSSVRFSGVITDNADNQQNIKVEKVYMSLFCDFSIIALDKTTEFLSHNTEPDPDRAAEAIRTFANARSEIFADPRSENS
jgi:hypothetical protein